MILVLVLRYRVPSKLSRVIFEIPLANFNSIVEYSTYENFQGKQRIPRDVRACASPSRHLLFRVSDPMPEAVERGANGANGESVILEQESIFAFHSLSQCKLA